VGYGTYSLASLGNLVLPCQGIRRSSLVGAELLLLYVGNNTCTNAVKPEIRSHQRPVKYYSSLVV